jgi:broad specificity phosphatase PhoE
MRAVYITHPQVVIDPQVPMPQWGLSVVGRDRAAALAAKNLLAPATRIFSSEETKAVELAEILALGCGGVVTRHAGMGENDRSSTGFLPAEAFEAQVDRLFGFPAESADGWETARDAQARIVGAVAAVLAAEAFVTPPVFTGHGCVGTLLKCHVGGRAITRSQDQREMADPGGGNFFVFDLAERELLCDWTPIEDFRGI